MFLPKRFQVLDEISRGDEEILLRARDELLHREVVISRPRADLGGPADAKELERALRQARALARVHHPGVVRLLDVLETPSGPVLVMEPVSGETLAELLARERRLPHERTRSLGMKLCEALEAVHGAGIVHRGISAANIVLRSDGSPCLTGFVFAKFRGSGHTLPGTTFDYKPGRGNDPGAGGARPMPPHPAPEQILGQAADARSDLFGLGWVLYQCLTGENPYPPDLDCERWPPPADLRRLAPGVPKPFAETVTRCLLPSPLKRFASAREVGEALAAAAPQAAGVAPVRPPASAQWRIAAAAAAAVILIALGLHFGMRGTDGDDSTARDETRGVSAKGLDLPRSGAGAIAYSDRYDRSHALLIGIGEAYARNGFPALPNAERDVAALAHRLKAIEGGNERWNVEVLEGRKATRDQILSRLSAVTREAKQDDKVFVYYAGHGVKHEVSEKSGWIIPADGVTEEQDASRMSWVRFDEFNHLFDESRAKHVLVAMDCCYGGRLITGRSGSAEAYNRRYLAEPAKIVISSGRRNEQVSDGVAGENSPFARAFLDALAGGQGEALTTTELFACIQRRFRDEDVKHEPVRGNPPGASPAGEVVFFLR